MSAMNNVVPKFGRVLIKRIVDEKIGSIYLPDQQQRRQSACAGTIIAMGETAGWVQVPVSGTDHCEYRQTMKIGDTVVFGRHAGAWLDETYTRGHIPGTTQIGTKSNNDGTLFICQDADILAVIDDEQREAA